MQLKPLTQLTRMFKSSYVADLKFKIISSYVAVAAIEIPAYIALPLIIDVWGRSILLFNFHTASTGRIKRVMQMSSPLSLSYVAPQKTSFCLLPAFPRHLLHHSSLPRTRWRKAPKLISLNI